MFGRPHTFVTELHREYGDVVRISPDELSFASPEAWRDIYGLGNKGDNSSPILKHFARYTKPVTGVDSLLTEPSDARHAQLRRIFSEAFSERVLIQLEPLFIRYADRLVQNLKQEIASCHDQCGTFGMVHSYNSTTFDMMGDAVFGESLHMLDNAGHDPWVRIVFRAIKIGVRLNVIQSTYPFLFRLVEVAIGRQLLNLRWLHFNFSATRVTKRLQEGRVAEGVDVWDFIQRQDDNGLDRAQVDVNASLFMLAGTETTATALSGLTYLILRHPKSLKKLVNEIREAFPASEDISLGALARMSYPNACIKEGLRLYPPTPTGHLRLVPKD